MNSIVGSINVDELELRVHNALHSPFSPIGLALEFSSGIKSSRLLTDKFLLYESSAFLSILNNFSCLFISLTDTLRKKNLTKSFCCFQRKIWWSKQNFGWLNQMFRWIHEITHLVKVLGLVKSTKIFASINQIFC